MARWKPNARERLQEAALELFHERGYLETTVDDIAARAELTERTFFRYFADKREVLFGGSELLQQTVAEGIANAPAKASPLAMVVSAFTLTEPFIHSAKARSRRRMNVINAHPELKERELIKMATIARVVADALRKRGVPDPQATLAAEAGTAIYKNAFDRWVAAGHDKDFSAYLHLAFADLRAVTAAS